MKKKTLVTILTLGVLISAGFFGANTILADESRPDDNLVIKIAQKFNLKEDEVRAVFDAVRDEKQEEMKKEREEKLSQAVKDGVITEDQKTAILNKMEENREERMHKKTDMRKWFEEQGIDETKLKEYLGFQKGPSSRGRNHILER